jgi:uncharacterized protein YkwD
MSLKKLLLITSLILAAMFTWTVVFQLLNYTGSEAPETPPPAVQEAPRPVFDITIEKLHQEVNEERTSAGLQALVLSQALNDSATNKCLDMSEFDYWAHKRPDGSEPWQFIQEQQVTYKGAGENLAKDFATSDGIVQGWMNSEGHRANVLNANFEHVGYGVCNDESFGTVVVQFLVDLP